MTIVEGGVVVSTETTETETGFVGNLTPDQERKLQQLWGLLLDKFEFDADAAKHDDEEDPEAADADGSSSAAEDGPPAHHKVGVDEASVAHRASSADADKLRQAWLRMLKQENPDALLLRFLRARKWDVGQAFSMLRGALLWRRNEVRVDEEILAKGEAWSARKEKTGEGKEKKDAREFLEQLRMGKVYIRGSDRKGRPVGYVHVACHKPGQQSQETLEKLIVQTIETARCLFAAPGNEAFFVVFDLTGFSLSNMEWQPVRFIIRAFEANYPECLGTLLIHNAPWIFSGIWRIIRGLLDPVVAAKISFTRNTEGLERYIARENLISAFGGSDDWVYSYIEPSLDEDTQISSGGATRQKILAEREEIAERYLAATQAWVHHVRVGEAEEEEAAIQAQLRRNCAEALWSNYWDLDPFVRSRTQLDRTGVIGADGTVQFYPERRKAAEEEERREREKETPSKKLRKHVSR
ncbi:CRAL-TRIO domain-containing protein [Xylaria arbuscula]|nr:CRAL-TRIO domain-containing protein [Xylaria arbuscula]